MGMKISIKKTEVLCLSGNPSQCTQQVSKNTMQHVGTFKSLRVIFTRTEGRTRRLIHGLATQTQFCVNFIALLSQNGSFQTQQSCQLLNRSLFRSLPIVINLG